MGSLKDFLADGVSSDFLADGVSEESFSRNPLRHTTVYQGCRNPHLVIARRPCLEMRHPMARRSCPWPRQSHSCSLFLERINVAP